MFPITRQWASSQVTCHMTCTCGVHDGPLHQSLARPLPHHQDVVSPALPLLPRQSPTRLLPTWSRYGPIREEKLLVLSNQKTWDTDTTSQSEDWRYTCRPTQMRAPLTYNLPHVFADKLASLYWSLRDQAPAPGLCTDHREAGAGASLDHALGTPKQEDTWYK